jgi:hypothetical protein
MRVMVLAKATEGMSLGEPTPEALEAFAAMDRFTEELVKAGVFVGSAGSSASPDTAGWSPTYARLICDRASARQAGLSPLRPWRKMRCDRRRLAPGRNSSSNRGDLSH